jgi:hypothetical protein
MKKASSQSAEPVIAIQENAFHPDFKQLPTASAINRQPMKRKKVHAPYFSVRVRAANRDAIFLSF